VKGSRFYLLPFPRPSSYPAGLQRHQNARQPDLHGSTNTPQISKFFLFQYFSLQSYLEYILLL
jgi:hypothetical protein